MKKPHFSFGGILGEGETSSFQRNMFALCLIGILVINWISNFYYVKDFFLYVDDYSRVPNMMRIMGGGFKAVVSAVFSHSINNRPLHGDLINAFSLIGLKLGGLPIVYFIGFLIISINSVLTFLLLIRMTEDFVSAFIGALAIFLYPVTTVKIWITSALGIQPALTLILLGFHCYVRDRKVLSYVLVTTSFFCYETFFWIFLCAPLMVKHWRRHFFSRIVVHGAILSAIFAAIFIFKIVYSDPRLEGNGFDGLLSIAVNHLIRGPYFNLIGNLKVPIKTLIRLDGMHLLLGLVFASVLFLFIKMIEFRQRLHPLKEGHFESGGLRNAGNPTDIPSIFRVLLVGLIMLILAYPLTFGGSISWFHDIASRIHLTGVIGISFIYAGMSGLVLQFFAHIRQRKIGLIILSLWLSLLIIFNLEVQKDYRLSKDIQRKFWTQLVRLCPDIKDGTLVFVNRDGFQRVNSISPLDWSTSIVLEKLYEFPSTWINPPRVYMINKAGWEGAIDSNHNMTLSDLNEKGVINLVIRSDAGRKIEACNSIFLVAEDGHIRRPGKRLDPDDKKVQGDIIEITLGNLKKGVLYSYLIDEK